MSGSSGEMGNLLKQAQQLQREIDRAREELKSLVVSATSSGGAVRVDANGEGMLVRVSIRPELLKGGDSGQLEELVLAAARDALTKATKLREERLSKVAGGLNLPHLF